MGVPDDWDVRGFGMAIGRFRSNLLRFAISLGLQDADAEDVVSRVTLKLLTLCSQGRIAHIQDLEAYSMTAVKHEAAAIYRRSEGEGRLLPQLFRMRAGDDPDDQLVGSELHDALLKIPTDLAKAFMLVAVLGYTQIEAAEILGCTQGTVSVRVQQATDRLAASLGEES